MKLRLPALNFRANLLPLFLRTRRIPILPTMLLLICLIAMTGRSFAAQLELDLLKDPGGLANAIHVWEFQADGSQVQQMTGGNTFSNATDGLTGSLEGAAGFFTVTISSVDNFDEVNFTNTLSDISGDKWAYNSAEANYGTKTPTDPLIQIQPGEAMLMTFDLSNLTLPSGKQLYVNGFKVQNGFTNSPGGQRISYLENGATNAVQLTGDSGEQNALVGGDDVIQPVGQSVDTGDQIAIWATSNFGQKRFVGFRFSVRQTVVLNTDDSGPGSLRQVLIDATSGDTITFDSALSGSTILLTSGQILIDKNIDIDASAVAGGITIDGNANGRIFEITAGTTSLFENLTLTNGLASGTAPNNYGGGILVKSGAVLTINSSTLSGNTAAFGGGILSSGMLTVNHSTLSSNTAVSSCGGIYNLEGTLIVNHSTLSGNTADALGGGIRNYNATGSVSINHSTLSGNKANTSRGGGIYNNGTLTLNSSTLSENTAYTYGGGIFNTSIGTLTLQNSTLSANTADDIGGGIRNNGGTLNSTNSIVADNMAPTGTNVYGSINSDVNNLTSGDPQLAPLGDYGGPTQTMPPLPGSPAIDAGLTSATNSLTDQRGLARVVNGIVDIGAVEYQAGTRYVDASNLNPIWPYTTWATAATTIQEAVDAALPADLVLVTNGVYATGGRLAAGLLPSNRVVIDKAVNVQSVNGPEVTVIEGAGPLGNSAVRCVWLADGASLEGFTLTNGATRTTGSADDRFGGGVYAQSTQGVVSNCTLTGNSAHYGGGGAYKGTLNNCVLSGNSAVFTTDSGGGGGALYSDMNDCILSGNTHVYVGGGHRGGTLNRCTLTGNSAQYGGGSYYSSLNAGEVNNSLYVSNSASLYGGGAYRVKLNNCTLVNNDAVTEGGGAAAGGSNGWLKNCIVYNNTAPTGPNLGITGTYAYTNVTYSCTTPLPAGAGNISDDPQLAPLGNYGGPTQTMPPLPGSPAIDAGLTSATNSLTDQRGFTRVVGSDVDMGSVESGNAIPGVDYTVTTSINDFPNGLDPAEVTLRDAIAFATNGTTITFDAALSGSTILLTSGQILIDKNIDIDASALAGGITIDGNGLVTSNRIFEITAGTTNVFDSLTLINGLATADSPANRGGAIYVNSGAHLTLHNSTLSGNSAYLGGGIYNLNSTLTLHNSTLSGNLATFGGGIFNIGTLTLNSSTLSGNSAVYGGGIYNYVGGTLTLHNSTLSGNSASFDGGGIFNYGTLTLHNSTLSDNAANTSGGGIFNIGTLTLNSSTLSGNSASFDGGGIYNNGGTLNSTNSIVADNMAATGTNVYGSINSDVNNLTIGDPQLAPLGDYGGPTQTMPPLPGSPAIDAGAATTLITDQRGAPRFDGLPDIGAVEAQATVLNTDDNGPGSLRNAVAYGGYTPITFTNTLSGSTILLTSGQILIDKNLDIDASAVAGGITIDGNGSVTSNRIFEITAGTTNVFDSLTLTNGLATGSFPADRGGAVYVNTGAHLTLQNSTLSGNTANFGGGIYNNGGTLTLHNSTLSSNSADFGGGIYNDYGSTLTLHNSTLSGNSAATGGGIYNDYGSTLTLQNSTLSGNTASSGGGIRNNGGTLTLHNSTLSGNTSTGFRSGGGGGIYNIFGGTLTLHNSTLSGNTANNYGGGGIVNDYGSTLTLHNSTLSGNTADFHGGIANYNGTLTLNNSTLSGNTANYGGGGIANGGTLNITNTIVAGNRDYAGFKNFSGNISSGVNNLTNGVPLLAPLGDYGGPTQTMPPLPGSPAIDAGGTTTNTTDQRGLTREVNAAVDIGAVEIQGASDTDSIIAAAWSTDADSDGNAFGVEFALGTDWNTSDGTNTANLAALSAGGAAFGFNPAAVPNTAWVLKRSLDLVTDPFVEIYRYDGPADMPIFSGIPISVNKTLDSIQVIDLSGVPEAYYQFEAEISP